MFRLLPALVASTLTLAGAPVLADPLGPSPTRGMDERTALLDIKAREAYALWRLHGNTAYLDLGKCLEAQKKTKSDYYSAVALCRSFAGVR